MRNGSQGAGAPWAAGGKGENFAELGVVNWGQPVAEETEVKPRPAFLGRGHARKVKLLPIPWKYQESSLQINWLGAGNKLRFQDGAGILPGGEPRMRANPEGLALAEPAISTGKARGLGRSSRSP